LFQSEDLHTSAHSKKVEKPLTTASQEESWPSRSKKKSIDSHLNSLYLRRILLQKEKNLMISRLFSESKSQLRRSRKTKMKSLFKLINSRSPLRFSRLLNLAKILNTKPLTKSKRNGLMLRKSQKKQRRRSSQKSHHSRTQIISPSNVLKKESQHSLKK